LEHARVIVAALDELTSAVDSATRAAFEHELLAVARERNPRDLAEWAARRGYEIDPGADAKLAAKEARAHERRGLWLEQNFARPGGRMIANLDAAGSPQPKRPSTLSRRLTPTTSRRTPRSTSPTSPTSPTPRAIRAQQGSGAPTR
jgi:hypothetical protein